MDSIRNKFNSVSKKMVAVIATVLLTLTCGVGIVLAAAGGGGEGEDHPTAGGNFQFCTVWFDMPKTGSIVGVNDDEPEQGWDGDSVNFFWELVQGCMENDSGLRLDAGTTASYQKEQFSNACYQALERCKTRENQKARIVAVGFFYSDSTAQGGNVALLGQYNENTYRDFFPEPAYEHQGNFMDLEHVWWEPCEQEDSLPGETWASYMWRIAGVDTCGGVDGKAPYSVIAIAVNEDFAQGRNITLKKHIIGDETDTLADDADRLSYEATKNNSCYDLSGAKFQLFDEDGFTPTEAKKVDSNGSETGDKVPVIYTTDSSGDTETYKLKNGTYWLREIQAPNKGFYKDTDGDNSPDEEDKSTGQGKQVVIKGKKITVDGVELPVYDKIGNKDRFCFDWYDLPLNDPQPIYLYKRDSLTGGLTPMPEGNATMNGARYRFAYYKGVYNKVEQLPGYDKITGKVDWSYADTTAIWESHSYTNPDTGHKFTGQIDFGLDDPVEGTWKYRSALSNLCPLGTLAIVEDTPPKGYLIDDRIYLYSVTDDGTHFKSNLDHTPWNADGSNGKYDRDWNAFLNDYELNGDRDDVSTPWQN